MKCWPRFTRCCRTDRIWTQPRECKITNAELRLYHFSRDCYWLITSAAEYTNSIGADTRRTETAKVITRTGWSCYRFRTPWLESGLNALPPAWFADELRGGSSIWQDPVINQWDERQMSCNDLCCRCLPRDSWVSCLLLWFSCSLVLLYLVYCVWPIYSALFGHHRNSHMRKATNTASACLTGYD